MRWAISYNEKCISISQSTKYEFKKMQHLDPLKGSMSKFKARQIYSLIVVRFIISFAMDS